MAPHAAPSPQQPSLDAEAAQFLKPGEMMVCYACRRTGTCRLGIRAVLPAGERAILAHAACPATHEGGPGVAHGGWTAATFDEVLGHLGPLNGGLTVTGTLKVEFLRPVPVERDVNVRAWVDRVEGRRWYLEGEMTLAATDALLGRAHGVFIERRAEHFENHRRWMQAQEAG